MKKKILFLMPLLFLFTLLVLASCEYKYVKQTGFEDPDFDAQDCLYIHTLCNVENSLSNTMKIRLGFARSKTRSFETEYDVYYWNESQSGIFYTLPSDFGTNKKYIVNSEGYMYIDEDRVIPKFSITKNEVKVTVDMSVMFPFESGKTYLFLAPKNQTYTFSDITKYAYVVWDYTKNDEMVKFYNTPDFTY